MTDDPHSLLTRTALPDALRVLAETMPREGWESHPNFSGLTQFWMERHLMFRRLMELLTASARGRLDGRVDPMKHARETQVYAGHLLGQLQGHHQIEDMHYFPVLRRFDRRIERAFDILDADHHVLDGELHAFASDVQEFLNDWDGAAGREGTAKLLTRLDGFGGFLDRHLADEEEIVVPVILTHAPDLH